MITAKMMKVILAITVTVIIHSGNANTADTDNDIGNGIVTITVITTRFPGSAAALDYGICLKGCRDPSMIDGRLLD